MIKQVSVLFYLLFILTPAKGEEIFAERLWQAHQQRQPTPHFSAFQATASETEAYQIQQQYVQLRQVSDPIAGYKAGLTSTAGQRKFGVSQALSAVLFDSGHIAHPQAISLQQAGKLMVETELGFILAKSISQPVTGRAELIQLVESVVAVIELPDLGYQDLGQLNGVDLIAANVASHQYLVGEKLPLSQLDDINQIATTLSFNHHVLFNGKASDALGDQWQALQWLINQLIAQGYQLSAGELLITGALGKMVPAQVGAYRAQFGPLGSLEFRIIP